LLLSNNRLRGTLPPLPFTLEILLLANNKLGGALSSFARFDKLSMLTLFQNDFEGALSLPADGHMKLLLVHSNRLSCHIEAPNTTMVDDGQDSNFRGKVLVLPGNKIHGPLPAHLPFSMERASFLYVSDFGAVWSHQLISVIVGLGLLVGAVAAAPHLQHKQLAEASWQQASCRALTAFLCVTPSAVRIKSYRRVLESQLWCFKVLVCWTALGLVVLVPLYNSGAHLYGCGSLWYTSSIVYLSDSPVVEWCCAAASLLYAGMCAAAIIELQVRERRRDAHQSDVLQSSTISSGDFCWKRHAVLVVLWLPTICILSLPMALAMLSLSLPPNENVLGLGEDVLFIAHATMGAALYLTKLHVLPNLAKFLTRIVYKKAAPKNTVGRLVMAGIFWIVVFVPAITVLVINEDCFAAWLKMWDWCKADGTFDNFFDQKVGEVSYEGLCTNSLGNGCYPNRANTSLIQQQITVIPITLQANITTHGQICNPQYVADGRCPRALVSSLSHLYGKDLSFNFGLGSLLSLLRATPQFRAAKKWLVRNLLGYPEYEPMTSVDRVVLGIVLMMELPILLGFCCPWLLLLASCAVGCNTGVLYTSIMQFEIVINPKSTTSGRISTSYLWLSLAMGSALTMWCFVECGLHGWWIAMFQPAVVALVIVIWRVRQQASEDGDGILADLEPPLLTATSEMTEGIDSARRSVEPQAYDHPQWIDESTMD